MRITDRDLDIEIRKKLNQFDSLKLSYDKSMSDGYIAYNGSEFFIKSAPEATIIENKTFPVVITEEDLYNFKKHIYKEDELFKNSFMSDFNHLDSRNAALINHVWDVNEPPLMNFSEDILITKSYQDSFYIFDASGTLTKITKDLLEYQIDILDLLKKTFLLNNFLIFDINTIEPDAGCVYITTSYGVYVLNESTRETELKFKKNNVLNIRILDNDKVFLSNKKGCYLYSNETGMKIESNYQLKNNFQIPIETKKHGDYIFVLSKSLGVNNGDKALHCWKKDAAGISYNNIDSSIRANTDDIHYMPKHIFVDGHDVYVGGIKNNCFFVWKYSLDSLHRPYKEIVFDRFNINDIAEFAVINNNYIIASGNKIYIFREDMQVLYNFNLKKPVKSFSFKDDIFRVAAGNSFIKFRIPEFQRKEEIVTLNVYSGEICNNIDIYIKGISEAETVSFIDGITNKEISHDYAVHHKDQTIYKLSNTATTKILMKIAVKQDSYIESIVVKKNAMFLL